MPSVHSLLAGLEEKQTKLIKNQKGASVSFHPGGSLEEWADSTGHQVYECATLSPDYAVLLGGLRVLFGVANEPAFCPIPKL